MSRVHRHRIKKTDAVKRQGRIRMVFQLLAAAFFNGYAFGFFKGKIFTGKSKMLCVPVLNCYSCPSALGSCPVGAIQAVAGGARYQFSFYVIGVLMLFGVLFGRLLCGFVCPFGLIQDLLYKIPVKKIDYRGKADKYLRLVKYVFLMAIVILLPVFAVNAFGIAPPYFCQYFCPAGTLEGGIPLLLTNAKLRRLAGILFGWKFAVLLLVIMGSIWISRFFCRYFCPLGAFYALFQRVSFYRMYLDRTKCSGCKTCEKVCPMAIDPLKNINSTECIRCGKCKASCTAGVIKTKDP